MTTKQIELTHVTLRKVPSYESVNTGRWIAEVKYGTASSETTCYFAPEVSEELLAFIGPLLVKHASAAAQAVASDMQHCVEAIGQPQITDGAT